MKILSLILVILFGILPILGSFDGVYAGDRKGALWQNYEKPYQLYHDPLMAPNSVPYEQK